MIYSHEVEEMCTVAQGVHHGAAPIPEEAKWVKSKEVKDISGLTHGVGWCAPQQGACKLTLNVKEGIIQEALVETIGCSGMTHSAAYMQPGSADTSMVMTVISSRIPKDSRSRLYSPIGSTIFPQDHMCWRKQSVLTNRDMSGQHQSILI